MRRTKADRESAPTPVGLGFRALKGGSVVVGVKVDDSSPRVVLSSFLATAAEGDRLSLEPYHVAAEMVRQGATPVQAGAAVALGRQRQGALAAKGLDEVLSKLDAQACKLSVAALLINRAGWIPDLLQYSLAFPDHPPVAEGLAVREALRLALGRQALELVEMDEKSLQEQASNALALKPAGIEARMQTLGAAAGRPWRKEQKLAGLAAWVALAVHQDQGRGSVRGARP